MYWSTFKDAIAHFLGVSHDVLHVHAGLALFVIAAWAFRRCQHWSLYALLAVLAMDLANEGADAVKWIRWTGHPNWAESAKDIGNTMLWPIVYVLVQRFGFPYRLLPLKAPNLGAASGHDQNSEKRAG